MFKLYLPLGAMLIAASLSGCSNINKQSTNQSINQDVIQAVDTGCGSTDTTTFESYISGNWQSGHPVQKLLITSDPQPYRYYRDDGSNDIGEPIWRNTMSVIMNMMNTQRRGSEYFPLIINGDLTEFGHGNERRSFREQIVKAEGSQKGPLFLPGLGNHDYANNVNDCANNGCARDAVCDHIIWTKTIQNKSSGVSFDHSVKKEGNETVHRGSLAYSFDIGNLHVVQLNLEPTYTVNFHTGDPIAGTRFIISSSMAWLENDLTAAKARGKYTIVNMHKYGNWKDDSVRTGKFADLVKNNKVVGIFAGDIHLDLGKIGVLGKVPVFRSGALMNKTWLRLLFDWNNHILQVDSYQHVTHKGEYKYNIDTFAELTPPPARTVKVKLYSNNSFGGTLCEMELTPGAMKTISKLCPGFPQRAGASLKVTGLSGPLCLTVPYTLNNRCFRGTYSGTFEVPNLTAWPSLPAGVTHTRGGIDNGYKQINY
ncbi:MULTISPECIES: metallophosphoesterase [unclassified Pseudomonas]|uniref:metallophosphoesterase family protein n=1 Tax=unclassified Pseudomonas TaxID=196821 RepID=UPI000B6E815E|nr:MULTISPECIES: metallophosphoesterase [Pseudomonas]SNS86472.1 Calcineurin-like phosphoesterase [Pseudomonas sp. LAMO17WK12:I8]SNY18588.1 Calcineurin-like phosphoesterase [Pseudomonas sp. LAMO17WK12:I11]SNY18602.1 Calcineurin-like phosphoesterase [Pseudomonas sp. LAMO17WK12:I7]SNY19104.1 Calcineurin-like phosphoesterase [Pseudomonas sp. LAMO17WK12:I12]